MVHRTRTLSALQAVAIASRKKNSDQNLSGRSPFRRRLSWRVDRLTNGWERSCLIWWLVQCDHKILFWIFGSFKTLKLVANGQAVDEKKLEMWGTDRSVRHKHANWLENWWK